MTESLTRAVPTPGDIAQRKPLPAAPAPQQGTYDRHQWEQELLAVALPHYAARLLGWGLAHLAGTTGYLPAGTTNTDRMGRQLNLTGRQVRQSLQQLHEAGLISRPDIRTWEPQEKVTRPITLTLPSARLVRREEPESPGGGR